METREESGYSVALGSANVGARTPRLVIDEARLQANIRSMADRVRHLGGVLRPHVKTHKSPEIMRRQLDEGARGITVATVREAEVMVGAGADDVLVAYPPVGAFRLEVIARLANRARVIVSCSEESHVRALAALSLDLEYYWEVDSGAGRLGTPPGDATAVVIERLVDIPGARFTGLMTFAGQAYGIDGQDELQAVVESERRSLVETAGALQARGIAPNVLSVGSTPLSPYEPGFATEYRFGNYVFYDATQVALGIVKPNDCSLAVEATVVGRPTPNRIVLDAGSKALAAERMTPATPDLGLVRDHPEVRVERLYEEHAVCSAPPRESGLRPGDRVEIIPNHACACANLHDHYAVRRADGSEERWKISARGW